MHTIAKDTVILTAEAPLAHVVFRKYKKEVCAWCFNYDRGKVWPKSYGHAHPSSPKQEVKIAWFCSDPCVGAWQDYHDDLTCRTLVALEVFSRDSVFSLGMKDHAPSPEEPKLSKGILDDSQVNEEWNATERVVEELRLVHQDKLRRRIIRDQTLLLKVDSHLDLDVVSYFVRGVIARYKSSTTWEGIYTLGPSTIAYFTGPNGHWVLKSHCLAYRLLQLILPKELLPFCDQASLRALVERDCTNAFGFSSDSGDEYLGYGVWVDASFFNHSCEPNVRKSTRGRSWVFETDTVIDTNEELSISYLGSQEELKMPVNMRREQLLRHWGFLCLCSRCVTESQLNSEP